MLTEDSLFADQEKQEGARKRSLSRFKRRGESPLRHDSMGDSEVLNRPDSRILTQKTGPPCRVPFQKPSEKINSRNRSEDPSGYGVPSHPSEPCQFRREASRRFMGCRGNGVDDQNKSCRASQNLENSSTGQRKISADLSSEATITPPWASPLIARTMSVGTNATSSLLFKFHLFIRSSSSLDFYFYVFHQFSYLPN